jgi:A/G-specific adenine glycosylase
MAPITRKRKPPARRVSPDASESSALVASESEASEPPVKKRKVASRTKAGTKKPWADIFNPQQPDPNLEHPPCQPPTRHHTIAYHRPLLLDSQDGRNALLKWFDSVSSSRSMPWRKPWIDPRAFSDPDSLRSALERRAYEVWISEIMLQQTRVAVVIDYWKRWMAKWPTIQDLAAAEPEDVLSAWRGLGYYSRATRIHEAAKIVVKDPELKGLLPADASKLKDKVPGVGRYTAGAISAIVFGRAEAMVDGNVIRVLSRQLGLFADFKACKDATELIWDAADALVKAVSRDGAGDERDDADVARGSDRPGRWGQALMELGSTVCTPKPNCSVCPVTSSCRAFGEGMLAAGAGDESSTSEISTPATLDIEDLCTLCGPMEDSEADAEAPRPLKKAKAKAAKATISQYFDKKEEEPRSTGIIVNYAAKFPTKGVKKAVRGEETLVCAIRRHDGRYLIQQRPKKGLLAGLWELPSSIIPEPTKTTAQSRKKLAQSFVTGLLKPLKGKAKLQHVGELDSVPWLFSHIKLTMHVHMFVLEEGHDEAPASARWETSEEIEEESMGTGMRKCWALVKESKSEAS